MAKPTKPKIIWLAEPGTDTRYCCYGQVVIAVHHELKMTVHGRDKIRLRCRVPRGTKLGGRCTFSTQKQADNVAELEAQRIYQNRLPIDFDRCEEWRTKAQVLEQITVICAKISRTPEQAAYELLQICQLCDGQTPTEVIMRYLDEFVRVKAHLTVDEILAKAIRRIERDKNRTDPVKRDYISVLNDFGDTVGRERLIEEVSVDECEEWYWDLDCGNKRAYDCWLVVRDMLRLAHKRYGAITRWTRDQIEDLNFSAVSGKLSTLLPLVLLQALWGRVEYINDALYLGILSNIPLRRAELERFRWEYIERWSDRRPRIFHLPAEAAKGRKGEKQERFIDIPEPLADLLLAFWQDSGPIIVGSGHQGRLKALLKDIDPKFGWPHNVLRRTIISNGVADKPDLGYWQQQAGHGPQEQKRYIRPVDPLLARQYRAYRPDLERLKQLPAVAPKKTKKARRQRVPVAGVTAAPGAATGQPPNRNSEPAGAKADAVVPVAPMSEPIPAAA